VLQQEAGWNLSPGRFPGVVRQLLWAEGEHPALSWDGRRASTSPRRNADKTQSCNGKEKIRLSASGMKFSELTNSFGCLSSLLEFRNHAPLTPRALCVRRTAVKHFIDRSYWQVDSCVASRLKNGLVFRPCTCLAAASESSAIFIKSLHFCPSFSCLWGICRPRSCLHRSSNNSLTRKSSGSIIACSGKMPKPSKFRVPALKFGPYFSLMSETGKLLNWC